MFTLISSLVPWAGPRATIAAGVAALVAITLGAVWLAGYSHGSAGAAAAVAKCNARWTIDTQNAEIAYEKLIAEARAAAAAVPPTPGDTPGIDRLCQQSMACRDRAGAAQNAR